MLVTLSGSITFVSAVQPLNALLPILVMLSGKLILIKFAQPSNALFPMLVTLLGIYTLLKFIALQNAFSLMVVTGFPLYVAGILIEITDSPWSFIAFAIGFVLGLGMLICAGIRYNR